jgi:hypothetical protein
MKALIGRPSSGRFFTLGREGIGLFASKISAVEQAIGLSRHHFASFSDTKCDGLEGGGRFTASVCQLIAGMLKENIATGGEKLPIQWPPLWSEYEDAKEEYAPGKGQWELSSTVLNAIGVQKRWGEAGRSVGIMYNKPVRKINFMVMRGEGWRKYKLLTKKHGRLKRKLKYSKIRPSTYALWNEFGTDPSAGSGGQPPRPVFIPTFKMFADRYLPELATAIKDSLDEDFKRLAKNIGKEGGRFGGEKLDKIVVGDYRDIPFVVKPSKILGDDEYGRKIREKMRQSGADKWLAGVEDLLPPED